jgi:hypothetical protein
MTTKTKLSAKTIACLYGGFVLLPLGIAVLIYGMFRVSLPPLLIWVWHQPPLKLGSNFDWLVYNVPDALWAFGFTSFLLIACRRDSPMVRKLYLTVGFVLMIGLEVGQGRWFAGTYDPLDVVATVVGAGLACVFLKRFVE